MGVPADTYEVMYTFSIKSTGLIPSIATRIGQEHLAVDASIKHDVTLPAIDVATLTATVTGTQALASNGSMFGRFIEVIVLNASHTLMATGMSITAGASIPISMWIPKETVTPFILVQESPLSLAPYTSGFISQFKLDPVTPTTDFALALPPTVKISEPSPIPTTCSRP